MLLMLLLVLLLRFAAAGMVIATLVLLKRLGAFPTGSQAPSAVPPHVKHQQRLQQQQHQQQQGPDDMDGVEYQQQQQELSTHASGLGAANGHAASDTAADSDAYRWVVM
jgi:hypothetical protein